MTVERLDRSSRATPTRWSPSCGPAARELSPTLRSSSARAGPQGAVPRPRPARSTPSKKGLPATDEVPRRAARRCWPSSTRSLRQLNPILDVPRRLQARAHRVLRQHRRRHAGANVPHARACSVHYLRTIEPDQPREPRRLSAPASARNRPNPYTLPGTSQVRQPARRHGHCRSPTRRASAAAASRRSSTTACSTRSAACR